MPQEKPKDRFYVYTLTDPRCGSVFYVGKGQGDRIKDHVREWRQGRVINQAKHARIDAIMKAGLSPVGQIVEGGLEEAEAFSKERAMIRSIGLDNLTNHQPGGNSEEVRLQRLFDFHNTQDGFLRAVKRGGAGLWHWARWVLLAADTLGIEKLTPEVLAAMNASERVPNTQKDKIVSEVLASGGFKLVPA